MAASVEEICLIDAEMNKEYIILLNGLDAEKARTDVNFATQLLEKAKRDAAVQSIESNTLLVTNNGNIIIT
ncbi:hypothetical protein ALC62_06839 [Cyphomyrmex costatus]|uniref:Uncharacterized protein n=1 Tax=Cyphomyrmex costatus TaxID=456900 RepID=A0A151IIE6_9HYME|nr:hypothetical protein ALC62_06839 [Cyphomyrmex costatus]